jgi:hypothetical protein
MKTIRILVILILTIFIMPSTYSQTMKGKISVGGSSGMNLSFIKYRMKSDDYESTYKLNYLMLVPEIGVFVTDGLQVGIKSTNIIFTSRISGYETKSFDFIISPYLKYYFGSAQVKPFLMGRIGGGDSYSKSSGSNSENEKETESIFDAGGSAGVGFFLNENVSFDLSLEYSYQLSKRLEDNNNNERSITDEFVGQIGIFAYF